MSSRRWADDDNSSVESEQLSQGVGNISLDSAEDDGGWEVYSKKSKNKAGSSAARQWPQNPAPAARGSQNAFPKQGAWNNAGYARGAGSAWSTQASEFKRPLGRGNGRPNSGVRVAENNLVTPQPVIQPPLQHGWNWKSRPGSSQGNDSGNGQGNTVTSSDLPEDEAEDEDDVDNADKDEDSDAYNDSEDELLSDGDYDSDTSQKSHETRKKNKWFKKFFEIMDDLKVEDINDPARQWHCPACQGGPGAIDWYRGLQPLLTHAKTKGSKRVKLHREFAELLEEEVRRRGTSIVPPGEVFGKWAGLNDNETDHDIVWPPMVIVMNTRLDKDDNDKWIGMGNQELLDCFGTFAAVRARHSYGPQGHRGMSVLIFEGSARGYLEAERLHRYFTEQGRDRLAWEKHRGYFLAGGKRQLYGYMAEKEDVDIFNQHCQGKSKLKFEMRSYKEMVLKQIKQMSEDNQQLTWLKNKFVKEKMHSRALQESFDFISERLRRTMEDNRIVMERTKKQHEQNKEEMAFQEDFFKNQIQEFNEAREAREDDFEKHQQERRQKAKQHSAGEYEKFVKLQDKQMEEFEEEREKLAKEHAENYAAMKERHRKEEIELQEQYSLKLDRLMKRYSAP